MAELQELSRKTCFTLEDVAQSLGMQTASARVLCSRYVRQGVLIRLKKGFYTTAWKWENLNRQDFFKIANILQVPSYISLMSALAYYEVTTQAQNNYQENICLKRSIVYNVREAVFNYVKVQARYYGDFVKTDGIFIATKEKAFVDAAYLYSFGKYKFDVDSLDMKKLDIKKLRSIIKIYPQKTKETVKRLCWI
ncbi:MAG TPA: type IV toxin-antitoxin system AbiEi family antitoxin domain-containing protein [Smithella sp.]|nr:type IV toxin-antitoxin system AbiEi family antitoxin domain-containing protein [Smithella sp.]HOX97833.1 type IV toxin-antitoxin system AbiEi family antitoxin domain-containing protein [Smithella sp.]HPK21918.1 type IV toxin-antitoxin system AbiEi family antitoxin domain-containing protein [Smithella sp.]HPN85668.1 type IV toxin-antitoxin system AbiEi family antitoxin domain-containing protein [Smithella sp.]HQC17988.1 type IV toxin-antitoxin system AbiEi family antitoxin domain-containing 